MSTLTVELSFYPLTQRYKERVIEFVHALRRHPDLRLHTAGMSTLISGDHDAVFNLLRDSTREFNAGEDTCVFVAKFVNRDAFDTPDID